jgi:hypothetical protein
MNQLRILYESSLFDDIIIFLKRKFSHTLDQVKVDSEIKDQVISFTWNDLLDPNEIAMTLTEKFPSLVIDVTPSQTGIDTTSRYFNQTQLW